MVAAAATDGVCGERSCSTTACIAHAEMACCCTTASHSQPFARAHVLNAAMPTTLAPITEFCTFSCQRSSGSSLAAYVHQTKDARVQYRLRQMGAEEQRM